MDMNDDTSIRGDVMDAIRKGRARMRPRWHFLLLSVLLITGVFIVFLALLYAASLALFFLRDTGAIFAPSFGIRGWFSLLRSLPWLLILLILVFTAVLEVLVRRYAFVYKKPLLASVVGILAFIVLGGFALAQTPLHRRLDLSARRGELPSPLGIVYRGALRRPPPDDVYRGKVITSVRGGFLMHDENGSGTTTVHIVPHTRLPYGEEFAPGDTVVVQGDETATGTVDAFGVSSIGGE